MCLQAVSTLSQAWKVKGILFFHLLAFRVSAYQCQHQGQRPPRPHVDEAFCPWTLKDFYHKVRLEEDSETVLGSGSLVAPHCQFFRTWGEISQMELSGRGESGESGVDLKLKLSHGSANGIIYFLSGAESHHVPSGPFYLLNHETVWPFSKRKYAEHVMQVWSTICLGRGSVRERKR